MPPKCEGKRQSNLPITKLLNKVRKLEEQLRTLQEKYESCLQNLIKLEKENVELKSTLQRIEGKADNELSTPGNYKAEEVDEENEHGIISGTEDASDYDYDDPNEVVPEDHNDQLLTNGQAAAPETSLQRNIVQFLDEIAIKKCSKPRSSLIPDVNCELDSFRTVLRRKLTSIMQEFGDEDHSSRKRVLKYYSSIPVTQPVNSEQVDSQCPVDNAILAEESSTNLMDEELGARDKVELTKKSVEKGPVSSSNRRKNVMKTFPCNQCGSCFGSKTQLERHMITHSSDYQYPCPHCGQLFKRKDDVPKHVRWKHENTRRFACSMCPKKFVDASGLRRHERRHLGIKSHLCSECGKTFPESANLKKHIASQHSKAVEGNRVHTHVEVC